MSTSPELSLLSTDAKVLKTRRSPKWHRVYYLLAAFDVLIVLLGMFLNHQIVSIYNRSVVINQEWVTRLTYYSDLGKLAGAVNAPGNNVFDTHDVTSESLKMREALHAFNKHMAAVEEELRVEIKEHARSEAIVQSDVNRLPADLAAIKTAMAEMTSEADLIFSYFRQKQPELAGRRMATMDNRYANVNASLADLRERVGMIQGKLSKAELAKVESLRKFEYLIAAFVFLMVGAATIYGHKIKNQMESDAREKERNLEEVQRERVNRRFRLLTEAIPQIVWTANPDGFLDYYNQRWFDYTGMTLEQTEGWGWQPVLHPDDVQHCVDVWANSVATGEIYEIEYRFKRAADGLYRWHLGRAVPVRDAEGQIIKWFGTCTDIDEHKRVEAELRQMREDLEQRVATRTADLTSANAALMEQMSERERVEEEFRKSESRFHSAFDYAPTGIVLVNPAGRFIQVNKSFCDIVGYTKEELLATDFQSITRLDDLAASSENLRRLVADEVTNCQFEEHYIHKLGHEVIALTSLSLVRDAQAEPLHFIAQIQDITENKRADEALRESEERYELAVEGSNDGLWDWNMVTNEVYFSPRWKSMLGYAEHEVENIFASWEAAVHPDDHAHALATIEAYVDGRTSHYTLEHRMRHKDGTYRWILARAALLRNEGNTPYRLSGSHTDITERKQIENELRQSEEKYRELIENANDILYTLDLSGRFTSLNRAGERLTGYTLAEALQMNIADVLGPDDVEPVRQRIANNLAGLSQPDFELEIFAKDGGRATLDISSRVIRQDGVAVGIQGIARDITERKQAEEVIKLREVQLTEAQHIANLGSWEWDVQTNKVNWSDELYRIFGLHPQEFDATYKAFLACVHPDDRKLLERALEQSLHDKVFPTLDHRIIRPDGTERTLQSNWRVTDDETGRTIKMVGTSLDITERKQLEFELIGARDAAIESTRLKSEFLANMSHEIRTPMNGVIGMTGLLLDTELTAEQRDFTQTINASADSLMTVINDILDFSKIEAGKLRFEKLDFDLLPAVEDPVELLAERTQAKGIKIASLIESDVPVALRGDAGRLRQVLTNLIGNAVKFTDAGEVVVRVTKQSETETHAKLRFTITDTGIGISKEAQGKLFQAFVQADGSTTRKYGGTGLGLAISKQLVEMMDGEIGVQSRVGTGSTFWFTAQLEKQPAATGASALVKGSLNRKRVLIVDDNTTNRKILVHQAISWGMIPAVAASGQRAFELLRAAAGEGEPFDLVILDLMMPEMDGFEVARTIKADESIASVRLMMLTSYGERGHAEQAHAAGVMAYLAKPVRQAQLFDCLTSLMGQTSATTDEAKPSPADSAMLIKHTLSEAKIMSDKRILVAEDNIVNQKVALRQLTKLGYVADTVANGREALKALGIITYDLILMDCQMPEMDGYEATAAIRARETDARRIPIIAMTAHALEGERAKCLAAGMDDYVSKPVKMEELEKLLANWLPVSSASTEEAGALEKLGKDDSPPVDLERLYLAMGDKPEELQETLEIYLEQMEDSLKRLTAAITAGDASEIDLIAHDCAGVSANCGMTAVVAPLRELERMGREGQLTGAAWQGAEVEREFRRTKIFLQKQLTQLV
jgi:two-component system sensor histidine kinase/response regulator